MDRIPRDGKQQVVHSRHTAQISRVAAHDGAAAVAVDSDTTTINLISPYGRVREIPISMGLLHPTKGLSMRNRASSRPCIPFLCSDVCSLTWQDDQIRSASHLSSVRPARSWRPGSGSAVDDFRPESGPTYDPYHPRMTDSQVSRVAYTYTYLFIYHIWV